MFRIRAKTGVLKKHHVGWEKRSVPTNVPESWWARRSRSFVLHIQIQIVTFYSSCPILNHTCSCPVFRIICGFYIQNCCTLIGLCDKVPLLMYTAQKITPSNWVIHKGIKPYHAFFHVYFP